MGAMTLCIARHLQQSPAKFCAIFSFQDSRPRQRLIPNAQNAVFKRRMLGVNAAVDDADDDAFAAQIGFEAKFRQMHFARRHIHKRLQIARRNDALHGRIIRKLAEPRERQKNRPDCAVRLVHPDLAGPEMLEISVFFAANKHHRPRRFRAVFINDDTE
ncbi:MAG: hypothetical protein ALAOOOJD_01844 [bacterium]|nr:hypothetical protein [bacterium]